MLKATAKTLLGWHLATTRLKNDLIFQICFLGATKHLYNWLCPSVGWSVGYAFVRRSTPSHLLAYLALFYLDNCGGLTGDWANDWQHTGGGFILDVFILIIVEAD